MEKALEVLVNFLELALAITAIGGVGGIGNQFLVIIVLGVAARLGHLAIPENFAFMASSAFLIPVTTYWLVALLAELGLTPGFVLSFTRSVAKAINTWFAPVFGGLLALLSVGFITHESPEFREVTNIVQLLSPSEVFSLSESSLGLMIAILAGTAGAAVLSVLFSGLSYLVNVGLQEEHGGHRVFSPAFDNGAVLFFLVCLYALKETNPWVTLSFIAATAAILGFLVLRLARQVSDIVDYVADHPKGGALLALEFFFWGQGGLVVSDPKAPQRRRRWFRFVTLYIFLTLSFFAVPFVGLMVECLLQPLMGLIYVYRSRKSAKALWRFLSP